MRIDAAKVRKIALSRGLSLNALLHKSGVSKTAYYHLCRKESVLPGSIRSISAALGVRPATFLTDRNHYIDKIKSVRAMADCIVAEDMNLDPENVRLTLLLLEEAPIERLERSLVRGRPGNIRL